MKDQLQILSGLADKLFNPPNITLSAVITFSLSGYSYLSNTKLFGVSVLFIGIICSFMVVDWFLGVYSSVAVQKNKFQSNKITYTIIKFLTFFMWIFLISQIKLELENYIWANEIIGVIHVFVLVLITLREFISIGENIEKIWGTKPYLFSLLDSVFETLEKLFKRKLESTVENITEIPEDIIEENNEEYQEPKQL